MTRRPGRPIPDGPGAVPVTTTMPQPLRDWLRRHAEARDVPMAQVITRALLLYRQSAEEAGVAAESGHDG